MSPRIRSQYFLILFVHVGIALVACDDLSTMPTGPVLLADCGQTPNYLSSTSLKRWTRFPVEVFVDDSSIPNEFRQDYVAGIRRGIGLWAEVTGGRIGDFTIQFEDPSAPIRVRISPTPLPDNAIGSTELTFTGEILVEAEVVVERSRLEGTALLASDVTSIISHEIGHVLGIIDHSPVASDKMWSSGNFVGANRSLDPVRLLTERDINTIRQAYCR